MKYLLTHVQDWLTAGGPAVPSVEWLSLLVLVLSATIILNAVTDAAEYARMAGNFLFLAGGAVLGALILPDWSPPLDPAAQFVLALFSGMALAGLVNMALFKPA